MGINKQRQIETVQLSDRFKNCENRFYYSFNAQQKIREFISIYHPECARDGETFLNEVLFPVKRKLESQRIALVENVNDGDRLNKKDRIDANTSIELYHMYLEDGCIIIQSQDYDDVPHRVKHWRRLGYSSQNHKRYVDAFKYKIDDNFNMWNSIDNGPWTVIHQQLEILIIGLIMYVKYDDWRHEYQDIPNPTIPKEDDDKKVKKPKTFLVRHISGHEHIQYVHAGSGIIDIQTGVQYVSVRECSRETHQPYWPLVHSSREGRNNRFRRI